MPGLCSLGSFRRWRQVDIETLAMGEWGHAEYLICTSDVLTPPAVTRTRGLSVVTYIVSSHFTFNSIYYSFWINNLSLSPEVEGLFI